MDIFASSVTPDSATMEETVVPHEGNMQAPCPGYLYHHEPLAVVLEGLKDPPFGPPKVANLKS